MASFVALQLDFHQPSDCTLLLHPTLDYHLLPNNIFHVGSNLNRTDGAVQRSIVSLLIVAAHQPGPRPPLIAFEHLSLYIQKHLGQSVAV